SRAPEDLGLQVPVAGVDQRLRNQPQRFKSRPVAAQSGLILGAAFDVLEYKVRNAPPRDRTKIGDVQRAREISPAEGTPLPGHESLALLLFVNADVVG